MNNPTIERIHEVMREQGMSVFEVPFSVTLGGIRTLDNKANTFNDFLFGSYFDETGKIQSVIVSGTTDAGKTYRIKPMNPKGTAIIQHGVQHRGVYQYQNPKVNNKQHGHHGQEAFVQIKDMKYWRDNNKNEILEWKDMPEEISTSATNGHDMGTLGKNVDNWSAGCWGSTQLNMDKLYLMAKIQIQHKLGDKFSFAMLLESMF